MHIHKIITINSICISPNNFFTIHSIQLNTRDSTENQLNQEGEKIKRRRAEIDEERRAGMWPELEGDSEKEGPKL